jgi:hypothetical protein
MGLTRFDGHPSSGFVPRRMSDHEERREKPRRHRAFTPEFKAKIVELCRRGDRLSITQWFTFDQILATATLYWLTEPSPARCAPAPIWPWPPTPSRRRTARF